MLTTALAKESTAEADRPMREAHSLGQVSAPKTGVALSGDRRFQVLFGADLDVIGVLKIAPELAVVLPDGAAAAVQASTPIRLRAEIRYITLAEISGQRVEYLLNGSPLAYGNASENFEATVTVPPANLGSAQLQVRLVDTDGVATLSSPLSVVVQAPEVRGAVRGVGGSGANREVQGWACVSSGSETLQVGLYADPVSEGAPLVSASANQALFEADTASQCPSGRAYGFRLPISSQIARQYADRTAYVRVLPQTGIGSTLLAESGVHVLNAVPRALLAKSQARVEVGSAVQLSLVDLQGLEADLGDTLSVTLKRNGASQSLCTLTTPNYTCLWTPTNDHLGVNAWEATLSDRFAAQSVSTLSFEVLPPANQPPSLILSTPASIVTIGRGGSLRFSGGATDADGLVDRVEVQNSQGALVLRIGRAELTNGQFDKSLQGLEVGGQLRVIAFDDLGAPSNTIAVSVTVQQNQPGTMAVVSPSASATYHRKQVVPFAANANDPDGIGSVQFVLNGSVVGTVTTPPFEMNWAADSEGTYKLEARLLDSAGVPTASVPVMFSVGSAAKAEDQVLPPPASNCRAGPVVIQPGTMPVTPGTWWNPKREGSGWEFLFVPGGQVVLVWFTFDSQGRPTWLTSEPASFNNGSFRARLFAHRWDYSADELDADATTAEGSVALSVLEGDPTRVALRWFWPGELPGMTPEDECIQDFGRASQQNQGVTELGEVAFGSYWAHDAGAVNVGPTRYANATYNGGWMDPADAGWGIYLTIAQQQNALRQFGYQETVRAAIYDDAGYPVWLLGAGPSNMPQPPQEQVQGTLDLAYFRSNYPGGVPRSNCEGDSCATVTNGAGSWERWYGGFAGENPPEGTLIRQRLRVNDPAHAVTLFDRPADVNDDPLALSREGLSIFEQVLVSSTYCEVLNGQDCRVAINWLWRESQYPGAGVFQRSCSAGDTGVRLLGPGNTSLPSQGEREITLANGACAVFELRDAGGAVLFRTHEVRAVAVQTPTVTLTAPSAGQTLSVGSSVTLRAVVQGFTASVSRVEFLTSGDVELCEDATAAADGSYSCTWQSITAGEHYLKARATTSTGDAVTSAVVRVTASVSGTLNEVVYYHHTNAQGSVVATTDWMGAPVHVAHYQPFGERINDVGTPKIGLGYTKQLHDDQLQLYYYGARYYDPLLTRFLSIDPAEFREDDWRTFNRYAYVNDSPLNYVDPDGRAAETVWDAFNIGLGVASLGYNLYHGNYGDAAWDAGGVVVDSAATLIPFVPGGAASALKAGRAVDNGGEAAQASASAANAAENATDVASPTGEFYSVAFQTTLGPASFPGVSRGRHFQEANENLLRAMEADVSFAHLLQQGGVNLQRTATGLAPRTAPKGWIWHHAQDPGVMQLVPKSQHTSGSIFWWTLHPGGKGGYSNWGK